VVHCVYGLELVGQAAFGDEVQRVFCRVGVFEAGAVQGGGGVVIRVEVGCLGVFGFGGIRFGGGGGGGVIVFAFTPLGMLPWSHSAARGL